MFVALDVGGSSIKSGCVRTSAESGELGGVGEVMTEPLDHTSDCATIVNVFVAAIAAVYPPDTTANDALDTIERIAIAIPDPFDLDQGVSLMQHKFAALYGFRLGDLITRTLADQRHPAATAPFSWCNDAAAAVAGEAASGAGRGCQRVFGITLGTGLGAAFIVDGQVVERVADYSIPGTYLLSTMDGRTADDALSARAYVERASSGGTPAEFGADLGKFIAPIVTAIGADIVVVGGGGLASFDRFATAMRAQLSVPVLPAQLDRWAPLIGAVALSKRRSVRPQGLEP